MVRGSSSRSQHLAEKSDHISYKISATKHQGSGRVSAHEKIYDGVLIFEEKAEPGSETKEMRGEDLVTVTPCRAVVSLRAPGHPAGTWRQSA